MVGFGYTNRYPAVLALSKRLGVPVQALQGFYKNGVAPDTGFAKSHIGSINADFPNATTAYGRALSERRVPHDGANLGEKGDIRPNEEDKLAISDNTAHQHSVIASNIVIVCALGQLANEAIR